MGNQGIHRQIAEGNTKYYTNLTTEVLDDFLKELSITNKKDNKLVIPIGDFTSRYLTALYKNDTIELNKLELESLMSIIERYKIISKQINIDYDLIYMLSSYFSLKNTFNKDVVWEIKTTYFNDNEYDDSYECTQLTWSKGEWLLETYFSDGWYENKKLETKKINDIFSEIILIK
jgi:hypothetical protein